MIVPLPLLGGAMASTVLLGWWMDRYQGDIDAYHDRDFRAPPVFTWPPVG